MFPCRSVDVFRLSLHLFLACWVIKDCFFEYLCISSFRVPEKRDRRTNQIQLPLPLPSVLPFFSPFFVTIVCFPMDSLVRPELFLLLLDQEDRSLKDHTRLFLLLANATTYPDDALCAFCPKRCFPNMVLERLLPPSWSGLWRETDCPSLSAMVRHRPAITSGLLSPGCASSIHPTGSVGLLPPISSTWVLSHSGSNVDLQISASTLVARALGSTLAPRIHSIPLALWLSFSTSGSSTTCSTAVGQLPGVGSHPLSMAPPSVGSTVDHHHVCQPPPGGSSSSWATSVVLPCMISLILSWFPAPVCL